MKIIKILINIFIAYLNIIIILDYIKTPMHYCEVIVGLNVIVAISLLNISFEECKKL